MRRTGHRVLRVAIAGRKITRHKITILSGCCDRNRERMKLLQTREIRSDVLDRSLGFIDRNVGVVGFQEPGWRWTRSQTENQGLRRMRQVFPEHCRKIHRQHFPLLANAQSPAEPGLESDRLEPNLQDV